MVMHAVDNLEELDGIAERSSNEGAGRCRGNRLLIRGAQELEKLFRIFLPAMRCCSRRRRGYRKSSLQEGVAISVDAATTTI
jgi:hypothetical protein